MAQYSAVLNRAVSNELGRAKLDSDEASGSVTMLTIFIEHVGEAVPLAG